MTTPTSNFKRSASKVKAAEHLSGAREPQAHGNNSSASTSQNRSGLISVPVVLSASAKKGDTSEGEEKSAPLPIRSRRASMQS
ncbi:hypothetical protein STCU_12052 [Strigomonas culicis]|uniref:Uncharacterized protein n=1 Tax=Strigomonas culicis TaxID=28005 RepID=S9UL41_9TRYP|nr:hypothetical protein STCU_12052 [Strigomonas culicis]|eukprot:EPY15406.1 hypothetical protein STCU_12052 [Strigomonas culicis]